MDLRAHIRDIPDFPKPGVLFRDITPLLADAGSLALSIELLDGSIPDDETVEDSYDEIAEGFGSTTQGLASFKRYRFGAGKVSRPWLWLLRYARRHG